MTRAAGVWIHLASAFHNRFGTPPEFAAAAPGRVNLIGEHTDYNDGFVLPVAIDRYLRVAAGNDQAPMITARSLQFPEEAVISTEDPAAAPVPAWARYIRAVAIVLRDAGVRLRGIKLVVGGELPAGAGVSSSAALEVAAALTLLHRAGAQVSSREVALLCRRAEVEFVGVAVGIMDQFAVALARASHALFLDCRTLEVDYVRLPDQVVIVLCDTGVRRALGDSAYNRRREECRRAVELLRAGRPEVRALRDLTTDDLPLIEALPEPLRRRTRHVVTENQRVIDGANALKHADLQRLGALLSASHASLRDDYEVSVPALDAMVDAALSAPGCVGARLTGAGFGGAAVAIVERGEAEAFVRYLAPEYARRTGLEGTFAVCEAVGGAQITDRPGETS